MSWSFSQRLHLLLTFQRHPLVCVLTARTFHFLKISRVLTTTLTQNRCHPRRPCPLSTAGPQEGSPGTLVASGFCKVNTERVVEEVEQFCWPEHPATVVSCPFAHPFGVPWGPEVGHGSFESALCNNSILSCATPFRPHAEQAWASQTCREADSAEGHGSGPGCLWRQVVH